MGARVLCSSFASVKHLFAPVAAKHRASSPARKGTAAAAAAADSKGMQLASVILLHPEAAWMLELAKKVPNFCSGLLQLTPTLAGVFDKVVARYSNVRSRSRPNSFEPYLNATHRNHTDRMAASLPP